MDARLTHTIHSPQGKKNPPRRRFPTSCHTHRRGNQFRSSLPLPRASLRQRRNPQGLRNRYRSHRQQVKTQPLRVKHRNPSQPSKQNISPLQGLSAINGQKTPVGSMFLSKRGSGLLKRGIKNEKILIFLPPPALLCIAFFGTAMHASP